MVANTAPFRAPAAQTRKPALSLNGRFANLAVRVLVAEDNIANQKVIAMMLNKLGIRSDFAANGQEAVEMVEMLPYDLILMDCQMPEMNGFEATVEIRRRERGDRRLTIIALTAHATVESRDKCLALGMDDFISKPVVVEELVNVFTKWATSNHPVSS